MRPPAMMYSVAMMSCTELGRRKNRAWAMRTTLPLSCEVYMVSWIPSHLYSRTPGLGAILGSGSRWISTHASPNPYVVHAVYTGPGIQNDPKLHSLFPGIGVGLGFSLCSVFWRSLPLGHFPRASADLICRVFTHGRSKLGSFARVLVLRSWILLCFYVFCVL